MFLDFYGLLQQPFGVTPDPAYIYPSRTHSEALASLSAAIKADRGFMALIAEPGMGKTTLLYQLLNELRDSARTVFLFQTQCDSREFFEYLLNEIGIDARGMGLVAMHTKLNSVLFEEMLAGKRFVLIVDEAQNLSPSVLETVRMLSNFETQNAKLLQIVLAGQPGLAEKLASPELSQLRQRIAVLSRLEPLNAEETALYIEHRLKVAGYWGEPLFAPDALEAIARYGDGTPRNINNICYNSLSVAHPQGLRAVTSEIVREALGLLGVVPEASQLVSAVDTLPEAAIVSEPPAPLEPVFVDAVLLSDASPAVKPDVKISQPLLSYEPRKQFGLGRWISNAVVLTCFLVIGSIRFGPSILKFPKLAHATAVPASSDVLPRMFLPPSATNSSDRVATSYTADPKDAGSVQVLTVVVRPQQTLKEISLLYVGHYNGQLFKEISSLNPELKDPDHLQGGQLIRLPLPPDALTKAVDTSETESAAKKETAGGMFTKVFGLLRGK